MGRTRRTFTAEEKLKVVMSVIQDGKAVSDVAKEKNIHPNMILNWKKEFLENAFMVFNHTRSDITEKAQQKKIDELEAKLQKKDEVIAEIAEENMLLKKNFWWPELGKEKVSLEKRTLIETEVRKLAGKTEISVAVIASFAGVSKSTWHEWQTEKVLRQNIITTRQDSTGIHRKSDRLL